MMLPPPPGEPTLEEIRERCLAVQAEWDENEFRRRAGYAASTGWTPPACHSVIGEPEAEAA